MAFMAQFLQSPEAQNYLIERKIPPTLEEDMRKFWLTTFGIPDITKRFEMIKTIEIDMTPVAKINS